MLQGNYRNTTGILKKWCRNTVGILLECFRNAAGMLQEYCRNTRIALAPGLCRHVTV